MVTCANCKHHEMIGALFCSECGSQLDAAAGYITGAFDSPDAGVTPDQTAEGPSNIESPVSDALLTLQILQHDAVIPLKSAGEYSIGRINPGQTVLPDVDLSAFDAYTSGVSRVHATIVITENRAELLDLGSSNGSFLNGRKLTPHVPYPLQQGDLVIFGKLQLRIHLKAS